MKLKSAIGDICNEHWLYSLRTINVSFATVQSNFSFFAFFQISDISQELHLFLVQWKEINLLFSSINPNRPIIS